MPTDYIGRMQNIEQAGRLDKVVDICAKGTEFNPKPAYPYLLQMALLTKVQGLPLAPTGMGACHTEL